MTGKNHIAALQLSILHQDGGDRPPALIQPCLDDSTGSSPVRRCTEFQDFGLQRDTVEQGVDSLSGFCGQVDKYGVSAPFLRDHFELGEFLPDAIRVRIGLVNLVYGNDEGHRTGLGVLYCFFGLRHDTVIRGHDQDDDIRYPGAARAHCRKRLMAGGIQESDGTVAGINAVCADMLCDPPRFARGNLAAPDIVKQ